MLPYERTNDRPRIVFVVSACAVYASGIAADAASRISQLTAEMLVALDDDDDNPFLTSDNDKDELETNELTVKDTD